MPQSEKDNKSKPPYKYTNPLGATNLKNQN